MRPENSLLTSHEKNFKDKIKIQLSTRPPSLIVGVIKLLKMGSWLKFSLVGFSVHKNHPQFVITQKFFVLLEAKIVLKA